MVDDDFVDVVVFGFVWCFLVYLCIVGVVFVVVGFECRGC